MTTTTTIPLGGIFSLLMLIHQKLSSDPAIQEAVIQVRKEIGPELQKLKKKMSGGGENYPHARRDRRTPSAPGSITRALQYVSSARRGEPYSP